MKIYSHGSPLYMIDLHTFQEVNRCMKLFEKIKLHYLKLKLNSSYRLIFNVNQPISNIIQLIDDDGLPQTIRRFVKINYKGYRIQIKSGRLHLTLTKDQLSAISHRLQYGAYNHQQPKSRSFLVNQTEEAIVGLYQEELRALYYYYQLLSIEEPLELLRHFAYQSLLATIAHKYRLSKKQAHQRLKEKNHTLVSFMAYAFSTPIYTGEPYTLKGVRTVLREVDSLYFTDPTTQHHLKKIFK